MSSVTKNPMVLQSAMYVYNWFISKLQSGDDAKIYNMLEEIESDKYIAGVIQKREENKKRYENLDGRKKDLEVQLNEYTK